MRRESERGNEILQNDTSALLSKLIPRGKRLTEEDNMYNTYLFFCMRELRGWCTPTEC